MNNSLSPYLCFQCQTFPEVAEDGGFVVRCHSCGLSVTDKHHRLNAISAWNIINDPVNNIRSTLLIQQRKGNPEASFLLRRLP